MGLRIPLLWYVAVGIFWAHRSMAIFSLGCEKCFLTLITFEHYLLFIIGGQLVFVFRYQRRPIEEETYRQTVVQLRDPCPVHNVLEVLTGK